MSKCEVIVVFSDEASSRQSSSSLTDQLLPTFLAAFVVSLGTNLISSALAPSSMFIIESLCDNKMMYFKLQVCDTKYNAPNTHLNTA